MIRIYQFGREELFKKGAQFTVLEQCFSGSAFQKGIDFGITIWLIIMIILMPLAGVGIFVRQYGITAAGVILTTDLIFGLVVAYSYKKLR
jgi:hypothetical protein